VQCHGQRNAKTQLGYYAKRFGKRFLMRIAAVAGLLFYVGMLSASSPAVLLGLQLLNAIYIGILAGIGMLYFQDPNARQATGSSSPACACGCRDPSAPSTIHSYSYDQ
jgi:hypothetical protein